MYVGFAAAFGCCSAGLADLMVVDEVPSLLLRLCFLLCGTFSVDDATLVEASARCSCSDVMHIALCSAGLANVLTRCHADAVDSRA